MSEESQKKREATLLLARKLLAVQSEIVTIGKDASVGYGNSSYRAVTCDKVLSRVLPICQSKGLLLTWSLYSASQDVATNFRKGKSGAPDRDVISAECQVLLTVTDTEGGASKQFLAPGGGIDAEDKALGKAFTYAMKYTVKGAFALRFGENDEDRLPEDDDTQMFSQAPAPSNGKTNGSQRPQVNSSSLAHVVEDITHRSLAELAKTPIVGKTSKGVPSYMAQKCPTLGALFKPGAKDPIGQLKDYFHKYHGATMEGPAFVLACIQFIKERYGAREALPFANVYSATFGHECPIPITLPTLSNIPLELDEVPYGN